MKEFKRLRPTAISACPHVALCVLPRQMVEHGDPASGVGGARLEGWPPLFPDASVRGEEGNIRYGYGLWHERNRRA